ncbi:uncharacterized protein A4U43_C03F16770 [Asparagus officinalis]|uniref:Uncharacterized protein n=1 Tax=Asparagus officinalis TaxID=4686 RepID=A0A5P1FFM1_ASPOF|nr:uncharacterized protein A4U43_C03F16770 [Asparagus officinalis]
MRRWVVAALERDEWENSEAGPQHSGCYDVPPEPFRRLLLRKDHLGVMMKRSPALFDNLSQALLMAPFFALIEVFNAMTTEWGIWATLEKSSSRLSLDHALNVGVTEEAVGHSFPYLMRNALWQSLVGRRLLTRSQTLGRSVSLLGL